MSRTIYYPIIHVINVQLWNESKHFQTKYKFKYVVYTHIVIYGLKSSPFLYKISPISQYI